MKPASFPKAVVEMMTDGFSMTKAFRHHAGLPIQYVASRSGIDVARMVVIENGCRASVEEIAAISKALELPRGVLDMGTF